MATDENRSGNLDVLTAMERRILVLIAENKTSREIAEELFVSHRTVQNHRYNMVRKLGLKGSNRLLEFAIKNREVLLEQPVWIAESGGVLPDRHVFPRRVGFFSPKNVLVGIVLLAGAFGLAVYFPGSGFLLTPDSGYDTGQLAEKHRIAVLPFRIIGPDSADAYLSNGLTEELITRISQIPELRVIAYSSVAAYRQQSGRFAEIARDLAVGSLLDGSVQKSGSRIRINVHLIDGASQEHLWDKIFDRNFSDILDIQQEIAWQVASALQVELLLKGLEGDPQETVNEEAHLAYLKGRYFVSLGTTGGFGKAIAQYGWAIELDSSYAGAWAGMADAYIWTSNYGLLPPEQAFGEARQAARKALQLAPDIAEAHTALAAIALLYDWDFEAAESQFQRSLSINPSDVVAHQLYALLNFCKGNAEEALKHTELALKVDPLSVISNAYRGRALYFARQHERALAQYRATLEIDPDFWLVHSYTGEASLALGQNEKAIAALQKAVELAPDNLVALGRLGYGLAAAGDHEQARQIISRLQANPGDNTAFSFQIALIYAALGEADRAFSWMQTAYENRHDFMLDLPMDPKLDPLRGDPRFTAFLEMMGFSR